MTTQLSLALLASVLALSSSAAQAQTLRVVCDSSDVGMRQTAAFDTRGPSFTSTLYDDALEAPSHLTSLSSSEVCGVATDFARACQVTSLDVSATSADYAFRCDNGIEGRVEWNTDNLTFSCSGKDGVYQFHSFVECRRAK